MFLVHLMQLLSTERANRNKDQLKLQETINEMQQSLESEQKAAEGNDQMFLLCYVIFFLPVLLLHLYCRLIE